MKAKALLAVGMLLLMAGVVWAAPCPDIAPLGAINGFGKFEPTAVATGDLGVIYATDYHNNFVAAFDKDGAQLRSIKIKRPLGIAMSSSGALYIGRTVDKRSEPVGAVDIYDANFNFKGTLGKGIGEFAYPVGIATDGDRVYVADSTANKVKVYNQADGSFLFEFGGGMVMPTSIAIDPKTGNLYIVDRTMYNDGTAWALGAGAYVFTRDGKPVADIKFPVTFGYSDGAGLMAAPSGIAIDSAGRVYISDLGKGNVQIFDLKGNYICDMKISKATLFPKDVKIGADGRMLVATNNGVLEYATESYVALAVSPDKMDKAFQECGPALGGMNVKLTNLGGGSLDWTITSDSAWLSVDSSSGSIAAKGDSYAGIKVDSAAVATGANTGKLTIAYQGGVESVTVNVNVYGAPTLSVEGGAMDFIVKGNVMPSASTVNVKLDGDQTGTMSWSASSASSWIGVSPSSGSSNTLGMALVGIASSGLPATGGTFDGSVTISAGCDAITPVVLPVSLQYIKGGTIKVVTNIDGASYKITGPETYTGSGKGFVVEAAPAGTYEITFNNVAGFKTPDGKSLLVSLGETSTFTGAYADLREMNNIIVGMGTANWNMADEIKFFEGNGTAAGSMVVSQGYGASGKGGSRVGSTAASGDVDGDGVEDLVVGSETGSITIYGVGGASSSFKAFNFDSAIDLAVADINGDGKADIIVSAGTANGLQAEVKAFTVKGGQVVSTGLDFIAYQKRNGANVAAGDVDGDGIAEIVTTRGGQGERVVEVNIWKVDASGSSWTAKASGGFTADKSLLGADVAVADVNADGIAEIVVASTPNGGGATDVAAYGAEGGKVAGFSVAVGGGAYLAAGDVDFDGSADIVIGDSAASGTSTVRVYGADGTQKAEFNAYDTSEISGARVSLGLTVGQ